MIALALLCIAITAFLFISTPTFIGPMFLDHPIWWDVLPALAVVGVIVGLVWMVRIYRADPEPDQKAWRYRAKR